MKNQETSGSTRRYDETFRRESVRLWKSGGRSAETKVRELAAPPDSKEARPAENEKLGAELARIGEQGDVLKKVAGVLSEPSQSSMSGSKH